MGSTVLTCARQAWTSSTELTRPRAMAWAASEAASVCGRLRSIRRSAGYLPCSNAAATSAPNRIGSTLKWLTLSRFGALALLGRRQGEHDVAVAAAHGEAERAVGGHLAEGLAGGVAGEHGLIVDLEDDVVLLEAAALRRAAAGDERDQRGVRRQAIRRRLCVTKDKTELGGDSFPGHRARHVDEPHRQGLAPAGAQHRQSDVA